MCLPCMLNIVEFLWLSRTELVHLQLTLPHVLLCAIAWHESCTGSCVQRLPAEAMGAYAQDLALIKEGVYKLPWDMTTLRHRQFNPAFVLQQGHRFVRETGNVLGARNSSAGVRLPALC